MRRGEVWVANLNPPRGREVGKIRPVLVVQSAELGADVTPMVVVLPLTRQVRPEFKRWRISLAARGRLLAPSQVVTDQPRAIDRERFGEGPLALLNGDEMSAVETSLKAVLELW
jgi:mRNA interferase MazF